MKQRAHRVSVEVDSSEVRGWSQYEITSSMLDPVDTFSMEVPFSRDAWKLLRCDRPIKIHIDGVCVLDGFIDDRKLPEDSGDIAIRGRDRVGRLQNESAPGIDFRGTDMLTLVGRLAAPMFGVVTLSNARNRRVLRGKGRKARAGREPVFVTTGKGTRIEPGQTRWQVIEDLCNQAKVLCWSAGDGRELILGRPNYDQAPQFRFFQAAAGSSRSADHNVLGLALDESMGDRYSEIIVVGSGGGTAANYGTAVSQRAGRAVNDRDFSVPKRLVIEKAVSSSAEAKAWAEREMARRDAQGHRVSVRVANHGQIVSGQNFTLFTPDTMVAVEDERIGTFESYLIVGCTYRSTRQGAEETALELVRRGQELVL